MEKLEGRAVRRLATILAADVAGGVELARQAIEVSKDDPETLCMAAFTLSIFAGDHITARAIVQRALRLSPNSVHAWMTSGWTSAHLGRPDPAIEALQRAMRLSPLDPLGYLSAAGLGFAHSVRHRCEEAIEWADRSLQQQPRFGIPIRLRIALCAYLDRTEETREWLGRLLELQPRLTIAKYRAAAKVWFSPEFLAWYLAGLRRADLPEG